MQNRSTEDKVSAEDLHHANFQDVHTGSVADAVSRLAHKGEGFLCEYGPRIDDDALVFHFYPPLDKTWDPAYAMDKRLSSAIHSTLQASKYQAGYAEEMESFYVIVFGAMLAPDPWSLCAMFFDAIESADVSETS